MKVFNDYFISESFFIDKKFTFKSLCKFLSSSINNKFDFYDEPMSTDVNDVSIKFGIKNFSYQGECFNNPAIFINGFSSGHETNIIILTFRNLVMFLFNVDRQEGKPNHSRRYDFSDDTFYPFEVYLLLDYVSRKCELNFNEINEICYNNCVDAKLIDSNFKINIISNLIELYQYISKDKLKVLKTYERFCRFLDYGNKAAYEHKKLWSDYYARIDCAKNNVDFDEWFSSLLKCKYYDNSHGREDIDFLINNSENFFDDQTFEKKKKKIKKSFIFFDSNFSSLEEVAMTIDTYAKVISIKYNDNLFKLKHIEIPKCMDIYSCCINELTSDIFNNFKIESTFLKNGIFYKFKERIMCLLCVFKL